VVPCTMVDRYSGFGRTLRLFLQGDGNICWQQVPPNLDACLTLYVTIIIFFHIYYVLLSILCVLCFCIVECIVSVLFLPMYTVVYFLFVYNFTEQCHRVETQLQLIRKYHIYIYIYIYSVSFSILLTPNPATSLQIYFSLI
jgi:hypothetical protein